MEQASVQPSLLKHTVTQLILVSSKSFSLGNFAKTRFEASWAIFWSLSAYKVLKLTTKRFTGRKLCGLLMPMQNISFLSLSIRRR